MLFSITAFRKALFPDRFAKRKDQDPKCNPHWFYKHCGFHFSKRLTEKLAFRFQQKNNVDGVKI